jgi:hypothetical protein
LSLLCPVIFLVVIYEHAGILINIYIYFFVFFFKARDKLSG